jgi:hypothetical protein
MKHLGVLPNQLMRIPLGSMTNRPKPPYLVIRRGLAFWVSSNPTDNCSARLQAFREGCYRDAFCLDATGGLWPILNARLKRKPSLLDRIVQTNWMPVELELGTRRDASLQEVVSHLADVLQGDSEFAQYLSESLDMLCDHFENARILEELIRIVQVHAAELDVMKEWSLPGGCTL